MIKDFEIKNFRGIQSLKLERFSNVNIFVGKPNTGKTYILEAIHFYLSYGSDRFFFASTSRGLMDTEGFFYKYNTDKNIIFKAENNEMNISFNQIKPDRFEVKLYNPNNISTNKISEFIPNTSNIRYENLIKNIETLIPIREKRKKLSEFCKKFSKDIKNIQLVRNKILVEKNNLSRAIDLRLMGNVFQNYISILSSILSEPQYILIDEIENGLHFESIDLLLETILEASDNIQFFITTHNEELLKHLSTILEKKKRQRKRSSF